MGEVISIYDIPDRRGRRGIRGDFICHDCTHVWRQMIRKIPKGAKCPRPGCGSKRVTFVEGDVKGFHTMLGKRSTK
jgi:hypothetical protein